MAPAPLDLAHAAAFLAVIDRLVDELTVREAHGQGREAWACLREYVLARAEVAARLVEAWRARGEAMVVLDPLQRLLGAYAVEGELVDLAWQELEDDLAALREDAEVERVFRRSPALRAWRLVVNAGDRLVWEIEPGEHFAVEGVTLEAWASAAPSSRPRASYQRTRGPPLAPAALAAWAADARAAGREVALGGTDVAAWPVQAPEAPPLTALLLLVPQLAVEASGVVALRERHLGRAAEADPLRAGLG